MKKYVLTIILVISCAAIYAQEDLTEECHGLKRRLMIKRQRLF